MLSKLFKLLFIVVLLILAPSLYAQTPAMAQAELAKRGISEEEMRAKLLEKGIDIDNVSPAELPAMEATIREAMAELEAEKKDSAVVQKKAVAEVQQIPSNAVEDVQKAVEDGKSIDEAISEEILEEKNTNAPPTNIYGHHIFRNKSIKIYNQATDVRAPDTYELGPKDVVNVSIWGYSELSKAYEVSLEGYIKPDRMAPIFVKGITLGDTKKLLRRAFSKYYNFKADEFAVNLNYSRTITVNITGEAIHPGSYTIPAINTAFNALVASGGPSDIGSVREITLVRPGKSPMKLDIYAYLANATIAQNAYLQDGDYIHIPISKKVVSISGAIIRPFRYELTSGENLTDLIEYAGGFKANAYNSKIQIKRFQGQEEKLIDLDYEKTKSFSLMNGDVVRVFSIPQRYENFVEISGEVALPGEYEIEKGWKLADLVAKGKLLKTSKTDLAFLQRKNNDGTFQFKRINLAKALENHASPENILLMPRDRLIIYAQSQFVDRAQISIAGAVRRSVKMPFDRSKKLKVEDFIQMANGLAPKATDFGFIYRKKEENSKDIEYILVDIKQALAHPESDANMVFEPFDRLFIPNNDTYLDDAAVMISGAVRKPGEYTYDISLTLDKVLLMSGGLKKSADKSRIEIYRIDFNEEPFKTRKVDVTIDDNGQVEGGDIILFPYDQIRVRLIPDFEYQKNVSIIGEVKYPGTYAITEDNEQLFQMLTKSGGPTDEAFLEGATLYRNQDGVGYIILKLDEVYKNKNSRFNIVLAAGDVISIPKMKDFVVVEGATKVGEYYNKEVIGPHNRINVPFHSGRRANFYVDEYAGGTSKYGKKKLITVRYPNGQLKETKNFLVFNVYPKVEKGATIYVGAQVKTVKEKQREEEKESVDWGKLLGDTIAQATTIITLLLLVQRIN